MVAPPVRYDEDRGWTIAAGVVALTLGGEEENLQCHLNSISDSCRQNPSIQGGRAIGDGRVARKAHQMAYKSAEASHGQRAAGLERTADLLGGRRACDRAL